MRELKFRAWDKVLKKIFDVKAIYFDGEMIGIKTGEEIDGEWTVVKKEHIDLIQYTGLQDRTGVEIYEGDIYLQGKNTYLVIYDDGFRYQQIYDSWVDRNVFNEERKSWISKVDCKLFINVIGNQFDNPELLGDARC